MNPAAEANSRPDYVAINGEIVRSEDAYVSIFDRGFLFGDGIYETLRVYNDRIFRWEEHWKRLWASAEAIGIQLSGSGHDLHETCRRTWQANGLRESYLRVTITRGIGVPGRLGIRDAGDPTTVVIARAAVLYPTEWYAKGVKLVFSSILRNHPLAQNPTVKATSLLNNILCRSEAESRDAFDGLMSNSEGFLTECSSSNFFLIQGDELKTPSIDCGILGGVTRSAVIEVADSIGLKVQEGEIQSDEAQDADEAFITNTTMEIIPVRELEGTPIGEHCPGRRTGYLIEEYKKLVEGETQ